MMTEHLDNNSWLRLFSREPGTAPDFALLAHIAQCKECRELYEAGKQLEASLSANPAVNITYRSDIGTYQSVASNNGPQAANENGSLRIDIDCDGSNIFFDEASMSAKGFANKYALYTDDDGRRLVDSGDLLSASISGSTVTVKLADGEPSATVELFVPGLESEPVRLTGQVSFSLPKDVQTCTLQIRFGQ